MLEVDAMRSPKEAGVPRFLLAIPHGVEPTLDGA